MVTKEARVPSAFMTLDRDTASIVLTVVEKYGSIKASTLAELTRLLDRIGRAYHIEVAVHPTEDSALMKIIDNEIDAQLTIENIKKLLKDKQSSYEESEK